MLRRRNDDFASHKQQQYYKCSRTHILGPERFHIVKHKKKYEHGIGRKKFGSKSWNVFECVQEIN